MMKNQRSEISCYRPFNIKKAKNRSAVNITASRCCPLFYVTVSQNSPLNMLRAVNLAATNYSGQSFEIATSRLQTFPDRNFSLTSRYNI
jgi:hypothetical protein